MFVFLLLPALAQAGFMLEPYLGHIATGDASANETTSNTIKFSNSYSGTTVGGRVGFSYKYLLFGGGYSMARFDMRYDATSDNGNSESYHDQYLAQYKSIFTGLILSSAFRLIGSYYQEVTLEDRDPVLMQNGSEVLGGPEGATQTGDKFYGRGYGALISYTGFKSLGFNLEYRKLIMRKFKDKRNENFGDITTTTFLGDGAVFTKYSTTELVITLSFPFEILTWKEGPRP